MFHRASVSKPHLSARAAFISTHQAFCARFDVDYGETFIQLGDRLVSATESLSHNKSETKFAFFYKAAVVNSTVIYSSPFLSRLLVP